MLNTLKDNEGARKTSKIVGRGIGSGKGKTCGSGVKGQKARTGVSINGFEGGQMPIHRRLPKRGFKSINRVDVQIITLSQISALVEKKKLKESDVIDRQKMVDLGVLPKNEKVLLKVLGQGGFKYKMKFKLDRYSKSALDKIKKSGGEVLTAA